MTEAAHDDHGHTVAAWTCVGILMFASLVMSLAVVFALPWLFFVGIVLGVVGVVVGRLLQLAGYGKKFPVDSPSAG